MLKPQHFVLFRGGANITTNLCKILKIYVFIFFCFNQVVPINMFLKGQLGVPGPSGPQGFPGEQGSKPTLVYVLMGDAVFNNK